MNQQLAYKLLAAFLVFTMLGSVFAYFFIGAKDDTTQEPSTPGTNTDKYNEEFWTVNQPFNSISDALNMTPPGTELAYYADLESMTPQMIQWTRQEFQLIQEVDKLYKSDTKKLYYAKLVSGNNETPPPFLLLSTMYPLKNDFDYIVLPNTDNILQRQDTGAINIMGTPVIYAPEKTASEVLNIIYGLNKSVTSYDQYETLLKKIEPAPYQMLNSNVSFARQFYLGVTLINGSYERTTAYIDANSTVLRKLNQSKANSTKKGFQQYNINQSGNYTIVNIVSPEMLTVLNEEIS